MSLNMIGWKKVRFGDLLSEKEIYKAKAYSKEDLLIAKYPDDNTISYVTMQLNEITRLSVLFMIII